MRNCFIGLSLLSLLVSPQLAAQQLSPDKLVGNQPYESPSCSSQDHREFDFMHGTWDMKVLIDGKWIPGGYSIHKPALGGCISFEMVSYENWGDFYRSLSGRTGFAAYAVNSYDRLTRNWRQVWHDDMGTVIGNFRGRKYQNGMRFVGRSPTENSAELQRFEWKITGTNLREFTFDLSTDGGTEWTQIARVQMIRRVEK